MPIVALTRRWPAGESRLSPSAACTEAIRLATSLAVSQQDLALLGQHEAARVAMEQRGAEILLERADLPADRRLAQAQPLGGAREAAGLRHGVEDPDPIPVHHHPSAPLLSRRSPAGAA